MAIYKKSMGSVLDQKPGKELPVPPAGDLAQARFVREKVLPEDGLTPQQRWRKKNAEHVKAKQRGYQKAYRERQKGKKDDR